MVESSIPPDAQISGKKTRYVEKQSNMTPPKDHNSPVRDSEDSELDEMPDK